MEACRKLQHSNSKTRVSQPARERPLSGSLGQSQPTPQLLRKWTTFQCPSVWACSLYP
ncbi:hypothetical protein DPMN_097796 [Dreissena polymorpha]|uniref:Uncharacterized protein n=1 Tax=Dreissena polymorpha TaxID=45954 RepID=A0A9D4LAW4_DREPO|nr:hypothetical protein DPMN_097796 [Dreissena polymorpha]